MLHTLCMLELLTCGYSVPVAASQGRGASSRGGMLDGATRTKMEVVVLSIEAKSHGLVQHLTRAAPAQLRAFFYSEFVLYFYDVDPQLLFRRDRHATKPPSARPLHSIERPRDPPSLLRSPGLKGMR
ncbi:hypothetical protein EDB80DRAFT_275097 [Ilyonectria destructans]|nr:hypothetical protein EDB80DRAFT_275097 [Ilyonectria destructans]